MSRVEPFRIDPVIEPGFTIGAADRIATAGSCFAQHIARALRATGYTYYVAERRPAGMSAEEAKSHNYGVFSARYGNIYTVAQLRQLFSEAFGRRSPREQVWTRADGRYVDPYRPQIEPGGFSSPEEVIQSRAQHLARVRAMFKALDVFVFTLGLTEAWRSLEDGSVFPLAPGVAGGRFDPSRHGFVNFDVSSVQEDLAAFIRDLRAVNANCRILLTVSPVPLIATFEPRHVIVSTTYSKAVLRVAAESAVRAFSDVEYFPSYEIIVGNHSRGVYFEDDLREVNQAGVDHAMRVFIRHYARGDREDLSRPAAERQDPGPPEAHQRQREIVCDEEAIEKIRVKAG